MAYGLKKITGTYQSNGTGRDWFFVGDFEYRHGRRTPPPNTFGQRPEPPPMQPRGPPVEIESGRQKLLGRQSSQAEKWLRRSQGLASSQGLSTTASEPSLSSVSWKEASQRARARRTKAPKGDGSTSKALHECSSWNYGNVPGNWSKYELERAVENARIGVPRGPCAADEHAGPGDHTRGIRASAPHFSATSHSLGQVESGLDKRTVNRDARVHEADKNFKRQEGDLSLGIVSKEPFHKSTMSELGEGQKFTTPETTSSLRAGVVRRSRESRLVREEYGSPDKFHFLSKAIFFDQPDLQAKKSQEGDHCLGIKVNKPHYVSTYSELGNIPGWRQKRYDFGVVADTRYRFTMWRE
eukprot:g20251.t1